ncbi:pyridoxal phosphate-dependent decarboxylase family protein [Rhodocytophaga aerolata]|uniref:pyridoxal phosphate-dependent decarboxylase family protein n=1 Tax=Rhodocytophaga aerolata TaxID=455078 RepID=UPI003671C6B1
MDFLTDASNYSPYPAFTRFTDPYFTIPDLPKKDVQLTESVKEILAHSMNAANPKYIGHMDSIPTLWSILGDYLASAINNNLLSLEMSPFLTQLEYSITKQFSTLFGLPDASGGILLSGGTLSNLQALIVARNEVLHTPNGNCFSLQKEPVIIASEHAHASIQKIAMLLGIGRENVVKVKTTQDAKMDIADLEYQVTNLLASGKQPFAIVATAGTTVSGTIDSLLDISALAKKYSLWVHIDAIYGGALIFSQKYTHLLAGIEHADSISFNPQKWLFVAKTCSMVLFRDFQNMVKSFQVAAPYMKAQPEFINLGEISIQGTKKAEVLKLWLSLTSIGKQGYEQLIDYNLHLTKIFTEELSKRTYLKVSSQPELNIVCFRGEPEYIGDHAYDQWNEQLQGYLLKNAGYFISLPTYKNNVWLRVVLLNPFFKKEHINVLFEHIDAFEKTYR